MRGTHSCWSSSYASSSFQHNYGSPRTRTNKVADIFLVSRCSRGRKNLGPYMWAFLSVQVDSVPTSRAVLAGGFPESKGAFFQFHYLGSLKPWTPGALDSVGEKRCLVVRAVTKEQIVLQEPQLLQLRRPPSVVRKVDMESVVLDFKGQELGCPCHDIPKVLKHSPKRSKQTTLLIRNPREDHTYRQGRSRVTSFQQCDAKVDEVIAALNQRRHNRIDMEMVMEHYKNISKANISGILTELQQRQDWQGAVEFFQWMKKQAWFFPNARQYTRLIGFLGREGKVDLACLHFQEMLLQKCKPDQYTFTAMLNAFGKAKMYDEALSVFNCMKDSRDPQCKPTTVTCNTLVDALLKGGRYNLAIKTFMDMKEERNGLDYNCTPNMVTYNILIDALCKDGHVELAVQMLYQMSEGDAEHAILPNVSTYNTLINACGRSGLYNKAEELMEHMIKHGHEADRITYTALIDAYGKAGHCESAENMFNGMRGSHIQVDVMAYTAMIDAYAREGLHEKAEALFDMMRNSGIRPNTVTYLALIEAYGKSGLPLAAEEVFKLMQREGFEANVLHYSALIDAYGKVGLFKEAADVYKMMKRLGCQPNLVTLSAMLASCTKCKTWEDARILIECLRTSGSNLELVVYNLLMEEDNLWKQSITILEQISAPKQMRQSLYNALMDVMWQFEMKEKGAKLVTLCKQHRIYTDEYFKEEWNLDLHGLSVGGAMVALLMWLNELRLAWLWGEDAPARLRIITGKGKHSRSKTSALKSPVESLLVELDSPFAMEDYGGYLVASGELVRAWLMEPSVKCQLQFTESENF